MFEILFFGAGAAVMLGMWLHCRLARERLMKNGTAVLARVIGTVEGRGGSAYVLEFKANGSMHRLHYPRPRKGEPLKVGSQVALFYDPYKPQKMFVDGDSAALMTEKFYLVIGEILLAIALLRVVR